MDKPISRITMFKVPTAEGRETLLNQYKILVKTAVKDEKPYIISCQAGEAGADPRSKGWSVVVTISFASKADMDYYDSECAAHGELKKIVKAKGVVEDVMAVWFVDVLAE